MGHFNSKLLVYQRVDVYSNDYTHHTVDGCEILHQLMDG